MAKIVGFLVEFPCCGYTANIVIEGKENDLPAAIGFIISEMALCPKHIQELANPENEKVSFKIMREGTVH